MAFSAHTGWCFSRHFATDRAVHKGSIFVTVAEFECEVASAEVLSDAARPVLKSIGVRHRGTGRDVGDLPGPGRPCAPSWEPDGVRWRSWPPWFAVAQTCAPYARESGQLSVFFVTHASSCSVAGPGMHRAAFDPSCSSRSPRRTYDALALTHR